MTMYIFVSGGVDSTAMTYALLNAAGGDIKNLHVIYTSASLEENPKLFEFLKTTGIDLVEAPVNGISDTLEKVPYGELINRYNAAIQERINAGDTPDELAQYIRKYFDALYGGIKEDQE